MEIEFIDNGGVFNLDINPHRDGNYACRSEERRVGKEG